MPVHGAQNTDDHNLVKRFLGRAHRRSTLPYLLAGALLVTGILIAGREIGRHVDAIEGSIASLGPWSIVVFVGLFVFTTTLFLPESLLGIIAGALFGFWHGLVAVVVGGMLAAVLQFMLAQRLLQPRIQRALAARPELAAIQRAVGRNTIGPQALVRLTPLNTTAINYLAAASGVRFTGLMFGWFAVVPHLVIEVYFGYAGKHVARIAGRSTRAVHLHDLAVMGGLAVTVTVMVLVSRMARKAVMGAVSGTTTEPAGAAE